MKNKEAARPWTVERVVGHLVEMRVNRLDSVEEVKRFSDAIVRTAAATSEAILLVDLRAPTVFAQPVAQAVIELMTRTNKVRRKTAILLSPEHAVFSMQLGRLVRQVGEPNRRAFTDPETMLTWLEEALSEVEYRRATEFIGQHKGLSSAS